MCVWPAFVDNTYSFSLPESDFKIMIDLKIDPSSTPLSSDKPINQPNFLVSFVSLDVVKEVPDDGSVLTSISLKPDPDPNCIVKLPEVNADTRKCGLTNAQIKYNGTQIVFASGELLPPKDFGPNAPKYDLTGDILLQWQPNS